MTRTITKLLIGNRKFEIGTDKVRLIEVQPPLAGIEYEDGTAMAVYAPTETMYWFHKEEMILVPDIQVDSKIIEETKNE